MNITTILIQLAEVISASTVISLFIKKWLDGQFKPLNDKIDSKDYADSKRYLTDFLTDIEKGFKKGKKLEEIKSEIQIQMASDTYDHYIGKLHGNSWIEEKWNKLMK